MSRQSHPFFKMQMQQLSTQLKRMVRQVRNKTVTREEALQEADKLLTESLTKISEYAVRINTIKGLKDTKLQSLSPEDIEQLKQKVKAALATYKEILADVK